MKYLNKFDYLVILFLLAVGTSLASSSEKYVSFLAGVLLIEENKNLTSVQKAHEYIQLQQLTGIRGTEAIKFIDNFKDRPAEFKQLYSSIVAKLTGAENSNQGNRN